MIYAINRAQHTFRKFTNFASAEKYMRELAESQSSRKDPRVQRVNLEKLFNSSVKKHMTDIFELTWTDDMNLLAEDPATRL